MKQSMIIAAVSVWAIFSVVSCAKEVKEAENTTRIEKIDSSAVLSPEDTEKLRKVEEVLQDFPSANAEIIGGELIISGKVSPTQARKIESSIKAIEISEFTNNLVIK